MKRLSRYRFVLPAFLVSVAISTGLMTHSPADSAVLVAGSNPTVTPASRPHPQRTGPFALVLVIDAARFDEIDLAQMPILSRLVNAGTTYTHAWVGQLPSITETSHATIGTGVLPGRHLVLGDTWRVPGTNTMAPNLLNGQLTRTGYIGKFIRQTGSPSLAALVHRHNRKALVVALSGHKIYAADALSAGSADFIGFGGLDARGHFVPQAIPGHAPIARILSSKQLDLPTYPRQPGLEDSWVTTYAEKFLFQYHPQVMMVNFPEMDTTGHEVGTAAAAIRPLMANIDRQLGRLLAAYGRASMLDQTYIAITSDHAMVPVTHGVTTGSIEKIVAAAGGSVLSMGHGDYCPIWLKDVASIPRVAAALANARLANVAGVYIKDPAGNYVLVSSATRLAEPGVNQAYADLLSSFASAESPDIVLVYDENTITLSPHLVQIKRKGDHGGASWGAQHIPLFISGPNIRKAYRSDYAARLVDIAPTLETLLGIAPQHQDGIPLADAMVHPPVWALSDLNRRGLQLNVDVKALEREATLRPNFGP